MDIIVKPFHKLTSDELYEILRLRVDVFVVEQNCAYREIDGLDKQATHVYFAENGEINAYLRILPPGATFDVPALGRIVTAKRGLGLGSAIVHEGIRLAREMFGETEIKIEAQTQARGFYEKLGFVQSSEEFSDAGILHIEMTLKPENFIT